MSAGPDALLELKKKYLIPCVYHFYRAPPQIVAAEGCHMIGHDGRRYLDCYSGVTVMNAGHCVPEILDAAASQMRTLQHSTTIYLTEPLLRLAQRLAGITPGNLNRSFFCCSGSEANDGALLLAMLYTGRSEFISLTDSLHGRTRATMAVTGLEMWRTDPAPPPGVHFAPHAHCPRCPLGKTVDACGMACAEAVEKIIQDRGPGRIAALIAEPIQGNGGIVVPPAGYWPRVREICREHGILLVVDEVQTAINRTGRWFALEHWDVEPDIVTIAKALGNGFPIAAFITRDEIASSYTRPGASTLGGNPVSAAAALATLDYHERHALGSHAAELGEWFMTELARLCDPYSCIAHVRGKGLMIGADIVDDQGNPAPAAMDDLLEGLKDRGFFCGKTGAHRNVLTIMPPLTIRKEDLQSLLATLDERLASLGAGRPAHRPDIGQGRPTTGSQLGHQAASKEAGRNHEKPSPARNAPPRR